MLTGAVGRRVHHIGAPKDAVFFTDFAEDLQPVLRSEPAITLVTLNDAEGIVCTGLNDDLTETPDDYRATLLLAKTKGLPMLCANPDIIVDLGDMRLFCAGALAVEYEKMGGKVLYFGKPHPPIYDLARRRLALLGTRDDAQILAIGDGITTDIQGGMSEGIDTLFVTGGISTNEFGGDPANPNPALLDSVHVDYYGASLPISQVANVALLDARTISIQPWEKGMGAKIEKAIRESDLGLNPASMGDLIRVPMPAMTEERRKELTKVVRGEGESAKVAVRNLRRDANEAVKKLVKEKLASEDDHKRSEVEIQKVTDRHIVAIDQLVAAKEQDLMAV